MRSCPEPERHKSSCQKCHAQQQQLNHREREGQEGGGVTAYRYGCGYVNVIIDVYDGCGYVRYACNGVINL